MPYALKHPNSTIHTISGCVIIGRKPTTIKPTSNPMLYVDSDMDGVSRNHIKVSVDENDVCRVSLLGVNESLLVSRGEEDEEDEGRKQPKRLQRGVPLVAREGDYIYVDWYRLDKVKGVEPECVFKVVKVDGKEGEDMDETTEVSEGGEREGGGGMLLTL